MKLIIQKIHFSKYATWIPSIVFAGICLIGILLNLNNPSTDFNFFYYPNAVSFLGDGNTYLLPDGRSYISDGTINQHGFHPAGYPFLIWIIIKMGLPMSTILILNILLVSLALRLFFKTFLQLGITQSVVFWSLIISALFPVVWFMPLTYGSESLFTFFLALAWLAFSHIIQKPNGFHYLLFAFSFILGTITRSAFVFVGFIPLIMLTIKVCRNSRFAIFSFSSATLSVLLWISINTSSSDSYLRRSIADGLKRFDNPMAKTMLENTKNKLDWKNEITQTAINSFAETPIDFLIFGIKKFSSVWYRTDSGLMDSVLIIPGFFLMFVFFIFPFISFSNQTKATLWLPVLYQALLATLTLSICRYMAPYFPLVFVMGGIVFNRLILRTSQHGI